MQLLQNITINKYTIKLKTSKQSSYKSIFYQELMELETLKAYIKTHLTTGFIQFSKSFASTSILFNKKLNRSFCSYVNYPSFNNLIIKNWYSFPLIGKLLNPLHGLKKFTQLNLINIYHQMRTKENNKWKMVFKTKYNHFQY